MRADQLLQGAGLRPTKARELVLNLLHQAARPLAHHEIAVRPEAERLDRVTLYRTLSTLQRAGLVHRVQGVDGVWRFRAHAAERVECPGNHPHFLCLSCGAMSCLDEQALPWVSVPEGTEVKGKQLVVYGRCRRCAAPGGERRLAPAPREERGSR
jgi:Fur family ferric uptake transcriptional regulator/Fur family zinc uptake transcriptional regulator